MVWSTGHFLRFWNFIFAQLSVKQSFNLKKKFANGLPKLLKMAFAKKRLFILFLPIDYHMVTKPQKAFFRKNFGFTGFLYHLRKNLGSLSRNKNTILSVNTCNTIKYYFSKSSQEVLTLVIALFRVNILNINNLYRSKTITAWQKAFVWKTMF